MEHLQNDMPFRSKTHLINASKDSQKDLGFPLQWALFIHKLGICRSEYPWMPCLQLEDLRGSPRHTRSHNQKCLPDVSKRLQRMGGHVQPGAAPGKELWLVFHYSLNSVSAVVPGTNHHPHTDINGPLYIIVDMGRKVLIPFLSSGHTNQTSLVTVLHWWLLVCLSCCQELGQAR